MSRLTSPSHRFCLGVVSDVVESRRGPVESLVVHASLSPQGLHNRMGIVICLDQRRCQKVAASRCVEQVNLGVGFP